MGSLVERADHVQHGDEAPPARNPVVKTIGDAIMATFVQPEEALKAGLEMLQGIDQMNATSQREELVLKIGIHRGAAISVTLNERIDYFGQTINTAARVQGSAGGNEIFITDDICASQGVGQVLEQAHCNVEPMQIELKGIDQPMNVYKVTAN